MKAAKAKGRRFQQQIAEMISKTILLNWGKDEEIFSRPGGQSGTDIGLSKKALLMFPFSVECKAQENWSIPSWIKQAKKNMLPDTDWLLFCKKSFEDPIVIMDFKTFFKLMKYRFNSEYTGKLE